MAKIFITGSSDGIGLAAAQLLTSQGHTVYLHARNAERASQAHAAVPSAAGVLIGDLSDLAACKQLAADANKLGPWDAIVHNAGLGPRIDELRTSEGFAGTFVVNVLAPYMLTALISPPKRLLYLSSVLHKGGDDSLRDVTWRDRKFQARQAYSDSKWMDTLLANGISRRWASVQSCSLDPGWIQTKMGGSGAPGRTQAPAKAIAEFAAGEGRGALGGKSGVYCTTSGPQAPHRSTLIETKQEELFRICEDLSGVALPS